MGRTVMPGNCALMGATRLASGIFQQPRDASGHFPAASVTFRPPRKRKITRGAERDKQLHTPPCIGREGMQLFVSSFVYSYPR